MAWEDFKAIYVKAWEGGAKGCTTFNAGGKRFGILGTDEGSNGPEVEEGAACYIDPDTGQKECS
jgi:ribonucleoside-diphosphate reductase alpha chain